MATHLRFGRGPRAQIKSKIRQVNSPLDLRPKGTFVNVAAQQLCAVPNPKQIPNRSWDVFGPDSFSQSCLSISDTAIHRVPKTRQLRPHMREHRLQSITSWPLVILPAWRKNADECGATCACVRACTRACRRASKRARRLCHAMSPDISRAIYRPSVCMNVAV